ncbi:MAG: hypothetical protein IPP48_09275 [Chitinophagaceae bacterium]|nr:hypothetical protein [Chitinophagaceae bacterium]
MNKLIIVLSDILPICAFLSFVCRIVLFYYIDDNAQPKQFNGILPLTAIIPFSTKDFIGKNKKIRIYANISLYLFFILMMLLLFVVLFGRFKGLDI